MFSFRFAHMNMIDVNILSDALQNSKYLLLKDDLKQTALRPNHEQVISSRKPWLSITSSLAERIKIL